MVNMNIARLKVANSIVGIDQVAKGQQCNCICLSCRAPLIAKKGESNEWHFAHSKGSIKECFYSFWVACRDLARQMLKSDNGDYCSQIALSVEKINVRAPWANSVNHRNYISVNSVQTSYVQFDGCHFDAKLDTSIGAIYLFFLTSKEEEANRKKEYLLKRRRFFQNYLILEIDLSRAYFQKNEISQFLKESLITSTMKKRWVKPLEPFIRKLPKQINNSLPEYPTINTIKPKQEPNIAFFKKDMLFEIHKEIKIDDSDTIAISQIPEFYNDALKKYGLYPYESMEYKELCNIRRHFLIGFQHEYFGMIIIGNGYLVYAQLREQYYPVCYSSFRDSIPIKLKKVLRETRRF